MPSLALIGAIVVASAIIALAAAIIRSERKRRVIVGAAAAASESQLETIYRLVERTGTLEPNGYLLARTNRTIDDERCLVPIPAGLAGFPWAGRVVEVTTPHEVEFSFVDVAPAAPTLLGKVCRPVQVPRHQAGASGKARNALAPETYLAHSPALRAALTEICPAFPAELLGYLLCLGNAGAGFDSMDQARIGTYPTWVQSPEHQSCDLCGKRMALILQVPGTAIHRKHLHEATFYFFGCTRHPEQTKRLAQFS